MFLKKKSVTCYLIWFKVIEHVIVICFVFDGWWGISMRAMTVSQCEIFCLKDLPVSSSNGPSLHLVTLPWWCSHGAL